MDKFTLTILITAMLQTVYSFDVICNATSQMIKFTISNVQDNIKDITFLQNTPNPGDPWTIHGHCDFKERTILECKNINQKQGQNFRIDLKLNDGKNASKELWYFDCFTQHGVKDLKIENVTWNGYDIKWKHRAEDELFLKEDVLLISDAKNTTIADKLKNAQTLKYRQASPTTNYTVCIKTIFFKFATDTSQSEQREISGACTHVMTTTKRKEKKSSVDIKTPLLAVGIGILCLVLLCLLFAIYNKKCKQGGDHDYDMNKDDTLMGGEGANEGEELQLYKDGKDKTVENGKEEV